MRCKMPKITTPRDNIVDEFEIVKILRTCKNDRELMFAVAVAWETGARISELLQLRPKDFSEEGDKWIVSVPTLKQRNLIHGQLPKRRLAIPKDWIYEHIIKPEILKQKNNDVAILLKTNRWSLAERLKCRYPEVYFHWFRHTRATLWSRKLNIFQLQFALGWKDIRMANIYVHKEQMTKQMGDALLDT